MTTETIVKQPQQPQQTEPQQPQQPQQTEPQQVAPPTSYAGYPGVFYIDPETKKTQRSLTTKFIETQSYAAKSPIAGYGCFAKKEIKSGEMIEECSAILLDTTTKSNKDWVVTQYMFTWPCDHQDPICNEHGATFFIPTGNALLYNHSDTPNSYWIYDRSMKRIFLSALRDIKENEELTWYYGHGYAKRLKDGTANGPNAGGCKPCQQRQKELEEKKRLKDALNQTPETNFTPDVIQEVDNNKKEMLNKWIESQRKEKITKVVKKDSVQFRSMVVPENTLDDNIQDNQV